MSITQSQLEGKTILLTGATRGVGRAIALKFAPHCVNFGLLGRSSENLEKVGDDVKSLGSNPFLMAVDLREPQLIENVVRRFTERYGSPHILINNAGIGDRRHWKHLSAKDELDMMAVNYIAPVLLTRLLLPGMLERSGPSQILNINSVAGLYTSPYTGAYCASKAALLAYFTSLAHELENTSVKISSIFTGPVNTDFMSHSGFACFKNRKDILTPDKVAQIALQAVTHPQERIFVGSPLNFLLIKLVNLQPLWFRKWIESRNPPPLPKTN